MSGVNVMNDQDISMVDIGFLKPIVMTSHVVCKEYATTQIRFVFNDAEMAKQDLPCLKYPSFELCTRTTVDGHDLSFFTDKGQVCIDVTTDGVLYDDPRTDFDDKLKSVALAIVKVVDLSDDDRVVDDMQYALNSAYRSYDKVSSTDMLLLIKYTIDRLSSTRS